MPVSCKPYTKLIPDVDPVACSTCGLSQVRNLDIPEVWYILENGLESSNVGRMVVVMDVRMAVDMEVPPNQVEPASTNVYVLQGLIHNLRWIEWVYALVLVRSSHL